MTFRAEEASAESGRGGVLLQLRLALSFLTIVPIRIDGANESDVAASMAWFPLIGVLMGVVFALTDRALALLLGPDIRAGVIVLVMTLITGAIHLDGLADTADALGAGRDRTRALEILRDSRIGAFGAIAIVFALLLKVLVLANVFGRRRVAALILAPMLARWSMVAVSYKIDYLRSSGAGSSMLGRGSDRNLAIASVIALLATIPFHTHKVIATYAITIVASIAMRSFYRRWLGGITGDLIGAWGEIVEILALTIITS
jgi:adenosylcobinamide-GDP ribazoletransferase